MAHFESTGASAWLRRPDWFEHVNSRTLRQDFFAGLTGATIVLPQAVAFAVIAGLPPEYGFYTAMIPPIFAAFFGSSWHAITGPTTAISAMVFASLSGLYEVGDPDFIRAAIVLSLMVGLIQIGFAASRLGAVINFVSHSVMTGFITGASLLILLSQIRYVFGIDLPRPEHLSAFGAELVAEIGHTNPASLSIGLLTLCVALAVRHFRPGWPNYLIALAAGTGLYFAFGPLAADVATVGHIDEALATFSLPGLRMEDVSTLGSAAFAIALVGLLEAVSISRALAMRSAQMIDPNREFLGQGIANLVGSFFRCYPSSGSFTRSGVNYEAGAKTPMASIFAALALAVILLFISDLFAYVPVPAMGGTIIVVALKLINLREIMHFFRVSKAESGIFIITFASSLAISLEFAIYCGVIISVVLFLDRAAHPRLSVGVPFQIRGRRSFRPVKEVGGTVCPQLIVVGLDGPLFFGSVDVIRREFRRIEAEYGEQSHMIFNMRGVGQIDLPAAELLIEEAKRRIARGGRLYVQTKIPRTIRQLEKYGVTGHIGGGTVHHYKGDAISFAIGELRHDICQACDVRLWHDCPTFPQLHPDTERASSTDRTERQD